VHAINHHTADREGGEAETLRELLKRHDVDINAQSGVGYTPLIDACSQGHLMAVTILIAAGADLALLSNASATALRTTEFLVAEDEENEGVEGLEGEDADTKREQLSVRDTRHEQHRLIVLAALVTIMADMRLDETVFGHPNPLYRNITREGDEK
jgi:hypothetical protein